MDPTADQSEPDPLDIFLAQPSHDYEEDGTSSADQVDSNSPPQGFRGAKGWKQRLTHFMFEKRPSQYSSIAPRKSDGTRTKIFFFNGSGRGR